MAEASLMGSRDAKNWPVEGCRAGRCIPAGRPPVSSDVRSGDEGKEELLPLRQSHTHTLWDLFVSSPTPPFRFPEGKW